MRRECEIERAGEVYDVYDLSRDELEQLHPTEQELLPIVKDIKDYCDKQTGFSYNDLKIYIYDNNNYTWQYVLRKPNIRGLISQYLRDKRKKDGIKYRNSFPESERLVSEAEERYLDRGEKGEIKKLGDSNNN